MSVETREPRVREAKVARVIYLAGQIEQINKMCRELQAQGGALLVEKQRLVGHLGFDPSAGKVEKCDPSA